MEDVSSRLYYSNKISFFNNDGVRLGRRIVLPSSYIGGQRNMAANYRDSMAIFRKYGKPDLFVAMTCNPKWVEITDLLLPHQKPEDRPDLVVRVFKIKLERLILEIKTGIFGAIKGFSYTIEFQKRGLPHAHIMLILQNKEEKMPLEA
jgi:Helitron helicase-like domain at N-terminus